MENKNNQNVVAEELTVTASRNEMDLVSN